MTGNFEAHSVVNFNTTFLCRFTLKNLRSLGQSLAVKTVSSFLNSGDLGQKDVN